MTGNPLSARQDATRHPQLQSAEKAEKVREQLETELAGIENVTLIALAGEQYRTALIHSPWPYEVPMKGLGIGQQLGWLTGKLAAA